MHGLSDGSGVQAYTFNPIGTYIQITFCPVPLRTFLIAAYPTTEALPTSIWSSVTTALDSLIFETTRSQKAPIDAVALFERIMLHEVSITYS